VIGDMTERVTLQRLANASGDYETLAEGGTVSAAVESLGEERYRVTIRWRPDLRGRQDLEPAMRVLWRDRTMDLDDVLVVSPDARAADRTGSVQLMASVRTVDTPDLLGHRRHQSWP
jgi:head-tail adaptor